MQEERRKRAVASRVASFTGSVSAHVCVVFLVLEALGPVIGTVRSTSTRVSSKLSLPVSLSAVGFRGSLIHIIVAKGGRGMKKKKPKKEELTSLNLQTREETKIKREKDNKGNVGKRADSNPSVLPASALM